MRLPNSWTLFQVWCLANTAVHAAPDPKAAPEPKAAPDHKAAPDLNPSLEADPLPVTTLIPRSELEPRFWPLVWEAFQAVGTIGGVLGVFNSLRGYGEEIMDSVHKKDKNKNGNSKEPEKPPAPWVVGIQVGLDGTGLHGAEGDFPQVCLWNSQGQLLGYNDQTIRVKSNLFKQHNGRPEGMPMITNGGLKTVGIYPPKGQEDLAVQQAAYVTVIKRHWDPICVASVGVGWPDNTFWMFDGSWGRSSNMSWYYSNIYDSDAAMRECFWLDHRGTLKHDQDLKEEFIASPIPALGHKQRKEYPSYLWASSVVPEDGIPLGDDLTEGMRANEVDQYRVPLGLKILLPAFKRATYRDSFDEMTVDDFVFNPGKLHWIYNSLLQRVRRGNPVLPIVHPHDELTEHNPRLIWEDEFNQKIPVDCLTDWYEDDGGTFTAPSHGERCFYETKDHHKYYCQDHWKRDEDQAPKLDGPGAGYASPSLHERHARTLVNDKNISRGGNDTKQICQDPHSVGPSYANHLERQFCRMTDKTLWPFCDSATEISHNCFDAEAEVLVQENRPLEKRMVFWDVIEDWEDGKRIVRPA